MFDAWSDGILPPCIAFDHPLAICSPLMVVAQIRILLSGSCTWIRCGDHQLAVVVDTRLFGWSTIIEALMKGFGPGNFDWPVIHAADNDRLAEA